MTVAIKQAVPAIRAFSRQFSQLMGLLEPRYMGGELSLVEARVTYEIRERQPVLARDVAQVLGLDPGYLSRTVAKLEKQGWIERGRGKDARERPLSLTSDGEDSYQALDSVTLAETEKLLAHLDKDGAVRLLNALDEAGDLLFREIQSDWSLRELRPGDLGHLCSRQAILYREHWGWGDGLEALMMEICAAYLRDFKPGKEQGWIAERNGRMLGSVFVANEDHETARLRMLYVEPEARGLGVGSALVRQCTQFARDAGYKRMVLWTHAVLDSARKIYAAEGYTVTSTEVQSEFGKEEISEHWLLEL
ncbi:helix-turn-helix domain-containing GNAT family N-acetyltransferase [Altererythrobacter sp.]|uniref:bifunctional helix-turn-helix transcriptional regulator/GNAT family N-acetyltransferase n=1 Tax=Altererythrobacter sp. TaxID=1872480 RepID=UPI001B1A0525|nr:helix-turn-helix domain-containing GNAT family N-acetyltransferase [Altererythrobacter sp.]MBO6610393.1 MarR family transcriptional regulator [Altererythrobacter sp.]MBO6642663.1 MarR family transcriptional regulator [Altererythrobacter sp.]MBO6708829.1 MarR family transcriptional regulator [Altererythrobacter sp.]